MGPGEAARQAILQTRLVAILRHVPTPLVGGVAQALAAGGVRALEVTFPSPHADAGRDTASAIGHLVRTLPGEVAVGAGTVLTVDQVEQAAQAGASFIVSPNTDQRVIARASELGLAALPGAATATECLAAHAAGASLVKLFPAGSLGLGYVKDLLQPLAGLPLVAVGGVNLDNAHQFIQAGCVAVGVGGSLVDQRLVQAQEFGQLRANAAEFLRVAQGLGGK
jgi:2-dehydro-3-deoxyphosphogluconate aldolase/(4S)-4-hydroxy-2-oxoglutarate aldolase